MAELVDAGDLKSPVIRIFLFSFCAVPVLFPALSHSSQADLGRYMRQLRTFFLQHVPWMLANTMWFANILPTICQLNIISICRHDGIGRRIRLKIWGWFQRAGSIPAGGTIHSARILIEGNAGAYFIPSMKFLLNIDRIYQNLFCGRCRSNFIFVVKMSINISCGLIGGVSKP